MVFDKKLTLNGLSSNAGNTTENALAKLLKASDNAFFDALWRIIRIVRSRITLNKFEFS